MIARLLARWLLSCRSAARSLARPLVPARSLDCPLIRPCSVARSFFRSLVLARSPDCPLVRPRSFLSLVLSRARAQFHNDSCLALPQGAAARRRLCRPVVGDDGHAFGPECLVALHALRVGAQVNLHPGLRAPLVRGGRGLYDMTATAATAAATTASDAAATDAKQRGRRRARRR